MKQLDTPNQFVNRRSFIKKAAWLTGGLVALRFPVWSKSIFAEGYPVHNIPENKNIDPAWTRALFTRGSATTYLKSKNELKYIGMPVGGLHAGTVYVGGDGRLWLWQIYNETYEGAHEGIEPKTVEWNDGTTLRKIRPRDGAAYIEPAIADNKRVLEQGFAISVKFKGKTLIKELNEAHWDEISFTGTYPVANIKYSSKDFPVAVNLKVYSPFIPLEAEKSALPATLLRLEVVNTTKTAIDVAVLGWMENGASKLTATQKSGKRVNRVVTSKERTSIFSSFEANPDEKIAYAVDNGNMCFSLHGPKSKVMASCNPWPVTSELFNAPEQLEAGVEAPGSLVGSIGASATVLPGKSMSADYSIAWYFNQVNPKLKKLVKDAEAGYHYGVRFKDAQEVSNFIQSHFKELSSATELWNTTWNDSSLPHWFLERTFVNIGTLATANTYRFANGRFWSWEGVGACPGTCTHVWQYAQAVGRIFPELERDLRQRVDLGLGFEESGAILFRGEQETRPAIDGQAGTILRFYREHQMSADDSFLKTNWPKIKKTVAFLIAQDKNGDGMTDTPMENTLDAVWDGEIAWIVGLSIAAVQAAQAMATEVGDNGFAKNCGQYVVAGRANMEKELFNGEYFIHRPDAQQGRKNLGSYNTCHIDQVYGQSWTFQVGLPRILSKEKTVSALRALWKYNFTMDVGPYIKTHIGGRPYALAGEGGMVMNTNPHNESKPFGENVSWQLGYFHECMSGFEHQVAAHMMAEDMVEESLILTRAIHDRHHAAKRNPFNEIECSDHYARAMASYGTFLSACGFEYHGPKGYISFAPKWNKENFKAPFTSASGWGTYSQVKTVTGQKHTIQLKYGSLTLNKLKFEKLAIGKAKAISIAINGKAVPSTFSQENDTLMMYTQKSIQINSGEELVITIS